MTGALQIKFNNTDYGCSPACSYSQSTGNANMPTTTSYAISSGSTTEITFTGTYTGFTSATY